MLASATDKKQTYSDSFLVLFSWLMKLSAYLVVRNPTFTLRAKLTRLWFPILWHCWYNTWFVILVLPSRVIRSVMYNWSIGMYNVCTFQCTKIHNFSAILHWFELWYLILAKEECYVTGKSYIIENNNNIILDTISVSLKLPCVNVSKKKRFLRKIG